MKIARAGLFFFLAVLGGARAQVDLFSLPLGAPHRKFDLRLLERGGILDTGLDRAIPFARLVERFARARVVLLGESHDNLDHHRFQARLVEALAARRGPLVVAMEFFRPEHDPVLAEYTAGRIGLEEMLVRAGWRGFNYRLYAPVLEAARRAGAQVVGVNLPRRVVRQVSRHGLEALGAEDRALFPELDLSIAEHRFLIRSIFGRSAVAGPERFERFYAAQSIWDTAMAANTLKALDEAGAGALAVVIVGGGHVYYDLGIPRRLRQLRPGIEVASLVQLAVAESQGKKGAAAAHPGMGGGGGRVVARSLADAVRGTPPAEKGLFPPLAARFTAAGEGGLEVASIHRRGALAGSGLAKGDRVLTLDGREFTDPAAATIHLMGKEWGDTLVVETAGGEGPRRIEVAYGKGGAAAAEAPAAEKPVEKPAKHPAKPGGKKPAKHPAEPAAEPGEKPAEAPEAVERPRHSLEVRLDPEARSIAWTDRIRFPAALVQAGRGRFVLVLDQQLAFEPVGQGRFGLRRMAVTPTTQGQQRWELEFPPPFDREKSAAFTGRGAFTAAPKLAGRDHARGFKTSRGTIGPEGVWLSGASRWLPRLAGAPLFTFRLEVEGPPDWAVISQGRRLSTQVAGGRRTTIYATTKPQEEIYLVGGPLVEQSGRAGEVATRVYLHRRDPELAGRYLAATARYLKMYSEMIGPYPWSKFALVENFWETGYGMPSFTLLGPRVIRFPWIIHTSYPHEILHNWWGNGVYVDHAKGNWCEGVTAYLADHLFKERKGEGADYRLYALERYTNFAAEAGRDFPLTRFRARHSPATEAVGYGKSLFVFHMLRRLLGEEDFFAALRRFYADNLHRRASWDDLRRASEAVAGRGLEAWFAQWLERTGAPLLAVAQPGVARAGEGEWRLSFSLRQAQEGEPYRLHVPVAVHLEGGEEPVRFEVELAGREAAVAKVFAARPLRFDVDPEFDLFRRLQPGEVPPSLSGVLGAEKCYAVLPAAAPDRVIAAYRKIARALASGRGKEVEILGDDDPRLAGGPPPEATLWVLGRENRLARLVAPALAQYEEVAPRLPEEGATLVLALPHPERRGAAWGFIHLEDPAAAAPLSRKLAHYGKYGYLVFQGEKARNQTKGRWPRTRSPLSIGVGPQ